MSRMWIPVSPMQARMHPLYGRRGWLTLFILSVVIGLLVSGGFWAILLTARTAADSLIRFLGVYAAVSAFAGLVVLALFIVKSPNFRIAAISLMLVPWPVLAAIYYRSVPETLILGGSAIWLLTIVIWVTYLQRSRRVRVTFEHCIAGEASNGRTEPGHTSQHFDTNGAAGQRDATGGMAQKFDAINSSHGDANASDTDPAEDCWAQALQEYEVDQKKPGLWARAYAEAEGDEATAKAHYLKLRATQLFDEYQEQAREIVKHQQAAEEAAELNDRYESSLTDHERKIKRAIEEVDHGGEGGFKAAFRLINLLGGTVERKPSVIFSSSGWRVELAGYQDKFTDDDELMGWVISDILPKARLLLPPKR
jgi:hypothetical protein